MTTDGWDDIKWNLYIIIGLSILCGFMIGLTVAPFLQAHGEESGTNISTTDTNKSKLSIDCIRMFYSDEWNKGYVADLAEYCRSLKK